MATPDKVKSSGVLLFQKSLSPTYATITSNAYNLSERLMRMQDFCLSGDTLVVTPDKGSRRIDEIVDAWNNGERDQLVFSYDHETNKTVSAKITGAKFIGEKEVVKAIFSDGSEIVCTPEHRFMLHDGSYVEAKDLLEKEMMPFRVECNFSCNLRCVKIEKLNVVIPVYDIEVVKYHNFAIASDRIHSVIFVHNCEMEQCLSGDTKIAIPGGYKRIDELAKECEEDINKTFIVYAYDHNKKQITPALAKQARQTVVEKSFKITFISGKSITGCEDHRLMLVDGTYCKIKDIRAGMLMMPFVRPNFCDEVKLQSRKNEFLEQIVDRTDVTFGRILRTVERTGADLKKLSIALDVSGEKILNVIDRFGYKNFETFAHAYSHIENELYLIDCDEQCEIVVSIEETGIIPLYDLTVDGYKNFATDSVISHNTPEIASTLDIVSDETVSVDDKGRALHVYSDNPKIKETVEELFYDTLNVEFNLRSIVRNTVKYGDGFQ